MEPNNQFQGMNSTSLCSLAGRYDNPIPTWFLAPIDCLKIPALFESSIICYIHMQYRYLVFKKYGIETQIKNKNTVWDFLLKISFESLKNSKQILTLSGIRYSELQIWILEANYFGSTMLQKRHITYIKTDIQ
jgi:hypothetical protein